jgi:rhodanese-related sulfurtransferase
MNHNFAKLMMVGIGVFIFFTCSGPNTLAEMEKYEDPQMLLELTKNMPDDYAIVDVRPAKQYEAGHIPTAINIPNGRMENISIPLPKNLKIILYCETGGRARKAGNLLLKQGYKFLYNFGGIGKWEFEKETTSNSWNESSPTNQTEENQQEGAPSLEDSSQLGMQSTFGDVQEIINSFSCTNCHGWASNYDGIMSKIIAGKPEDSILYLKVKDESMPPKDNKLSDSQKQIIYNWISHGAKSEQTLIRHIVIFQIFFTYLFFAKCIPNVSYITNNKRYQ